MLFRAKCAKVLSPHMLMSFPKKKGKEKKRKKKIFKKEKNFEKKFDF